MIKCRYSESGIVRSRVSKGTCLEEKKTPACHSPQISLDKALNQFPCPEQVRLLPSIVGRNKLSQKGFKYSALKYSVNGTVGPL